MLGLSQSIETPLGPLSHISPVIYKGSEDLPALAKLLTFSLS